MAIDIADDITAGVGHSVAPVVVQAKNLKKLEIEIDNLETALKKKKEEYSTLATETLPNLMDSVGVSALALANGYQLELKDVFCASLPAKSTIERANEEEQPVLIKRFQDGLSWLRGHKAHDIIRNTLKLDLGKGQDKAAKQIITLAKKLKIQIDRSETVHPGTLASFLKEKLSKGTSVPFDTFAIFNGREAIIKSPKKGKEK